MSKRPFYALPIFILVFLMMSNCRKTLEPTEVDMAEYGWVLYSGGKFKDYKKANEWFVDAVFEDSLYKDGYNGLGWTYGKLGDINASIVNFTLGRNMALSDTTVDDLNLLGADPPHDVPKETTAGLALAYHAKNNHEGSVLYGSSLLSMTGDSAYARAQGAPKWKFSRDGRLDAKHVIWIVASSYYALGNFGKSLEHIRQLLSDPDSFSPDSTTAEGWWELADRIEELGEDISAGGGL